jgi:hypothetical protein
MIMSGVLLEVESVPGDRRKRVLTMSEGGLDVSGTSFGWAEIDRVQYSAVDRYVNGAYLGTTFTIKVGNAAKKKVWFTLNSGMTGPLKTQIDYQRRDRNRAEWVKAVEILDRCVSIRLIMDAVTTLRGGGTIEFAGLRLDPQGIHKSGLLRTKSVAWNDISGTETRSEYLCIFSKARGRVKNAIQRELDGWNVVLLPRVITAMTASRP